MILETLAGSRASAPMLADAGAKSKYEQSVEKQLDGIWDTMFPRSRKYYDNLIKEALAAKGRLKRLRAAKRGKAGKDD
jgi:hypothetical protein